MMNGAGEQEPIKKEKAVSVIMSDLDRLAERAEQLADSIAIRLEPISAPESQSFEKGKPDVMQVEKAMPLLFADIRSKYRRVQAALSICEDAIDRLEV